jgi:parallel beta-helix repeat protein
MRLTHGKSVVGGAMQVSNHCALSLRYADVTANQAAIQGGGVYASEGNLFITQSSITGNFAPAGGGVSGYSCVVEVTQSTISGNQATYMGAGLYITHSSYVGLKSSTVSGNSIPMPSGPYYKPLGGAGVLVAGSKINSENATIAYNYAFAGGGGIRLNDAYSSSFASIYSSTIVGNSTCCYDGGNGILSIGATTKFTLTIVANNFNRGGNDDLAGSFDIYKSLVRDTGGATVSATNSHLGADPLLGKLGVNGGPTLTMLPAGGSPALDAAGTCSDGKTLYDQRGVSRCVNGHVDMGAVERQSPEVIIFRNGFDPGG